MPDPQEIPDHIHSQAAEWLIQQQSGTPGTASALEAWLQKDPRHRRAYETVGDLWTATGQLVTRPIAQGRKLRRAPLYMRRRTHVAVAAFGVVACLGLGTALVVRDNLPFALVPSAQAAVYKTQTGEIRTFSLADGPSLVLDSASRVSVVRHGATYKIALLEGRVRVRAAQGAEPLLIIARDKRAHVRGAAYDVSLIGAAPTLLAVEGPTSMVGALGATSLAPGQAAVLGCVACAPRQVPRGEVQWVSGMLVFAATPLDQAVRAINRYNLIKIRLVAPSLAKRRVTGAYRTSDPQAFARALATLFGLKIDLSRRGEIILASS
jgi:transmembrane sensor